MPQTIDLHSHSTYSDGVLQPADLVARAAEMGVTALALTDHDEIGGLEEAQAAADKHGIRLVPGVEISATWRAGLTIHIVGLGIDPANAVLREGLASICAGREDRARRMAQALEVCGIPGALEGARKYAENPRIIGRTHFARYLVECGKVKDIHAAFKRYLGGGQPCYVPHEWISIPEAVRWITAAGGIAVIAHPGRYPLGSQEMHELIAEFKACGGGALEVVSGSHTPNQYKIYARYAAEFGLAASAGSDFHSPQESRCELGGLPPLPEGCIPVWRQLGLDAAALAPAA